MRILVCGGRDFGIKHKEYEFIHRKLHQIVEDYGRNKPIIPIIIVGGARGADTAAEDWAVMNWCAYEKYPADWVRHGKAAGVIRNRKMLMEGKPVLVVAFPGGKGTANMAGQARVAGIPVMEIEYEMGTENLFA